MSRLSGNSSKNGYVPRRIMKRLLRFRTASDHHWDLENKLQALAVKSGIKPAFMNFAAGMIAADRVEFRQLAALLGLHYKVTAAPPLRPTRKLNVKDSFFKASTDVFQPKDAVWLYSDIQVESRISRCILGEINVGYILGYPRCCIEWHEGMRAFDLESLFRWIEEHITNNPQMFRGIQDRTEVEIYRFALLEWRMPAPDFMSESKRLYPFAPHYACPSCLSRESEETEKLNNQYKELAFSLNPKFAQEIEQSASDSLRESSGQART